MRTTKVVVLPYDEAWKSAFEKIKSEIVGIEPDFAYEIMADENESVHLVLSNDDFENLLHATCATPNGVQKMSDEIKGLVERGYKEVVLTGIHISSYGIDVDRQSHLLDLIQEIHNIEGIERIRLGSLEPEYLDENVLKRLSKVVEFCPQFHLSLQSGCDKTLKDMKAEVLIEKKEGKRYFGHARNYLPLYVESEKDIINEIVNTVIK